MVDIIICERIGFRVLGCVSRFGLWGSVLRAWAWVGVVGGDLGFGALVFRVWG